MATPLKLSNIFPFKKTTFNVTVPKFAISQSEAESNLLISYDIIHQIVLLPRDWSKRVTWANIPQLKLGNIQD